MVTRKHNFFHTLDGFYRLATFLRTVAFPALRGRLAESLRGGESAKASADCDDSWLRHLFPAVDVTGGDGDHESGLQIGTIRVCGQYTPSSKIEEREPPRGG